MRFTSAICRVGALFALAAALGCNNKPKGKGTGTTSESSATGGVAMNGPNPRQAADAFLKTLSEGKATPEQFTAWFKKQSAKPIAEIDPVDWLASFKGTNFVVGEELKFGAAIVLRGRAETGTQKDAFSLRMVKEGDAFKVDWLHRSGRFGQGASTSDAELAAAQDVARNFLDVLIGGEIRQASPLMTLTWKKSMWDPNKEIDLGMVTQKLRFMKRDLNGYAIVKAELDNSKDAASFTLEGYEGSNKASYAVKAKKVDGQWLIDGFSKS